MEPISRRKKKKTRKFLNDLRKGHLNNENIVKMIRLSKNYNKISINDNCIIRPNRLTLRLFNKAVRSETVTRSVLSKTFQQPDLNTKYMNEKNHLGYKNCNNIGSKNNLLIYKAITPEKYFLEDNCGIKNGNKENFKCKNDHLNSRTLHRAYYLYSTPTGNPPIIPPSESANYLSLTELPIDSFSPYLNNSLQLYEELISCMPKYLLKKAPLLMKYEVWKSTKEFLYNHYVLDNDNETEKNILQCVQTKICREGNNLDDVNFSPTASIQQDPINYLKSTCASEKHKTVIPLNISNSSDTDGTMSNVSHSVIYDTPECIYFPHKLNH